MMQRKGIMAGMTLLGIEVGQIESLRACVACLVVAKSSTALSL